MTMETEQLQHTKRNKTKPMTSHSTWARHGSLQAARDVIKTIRYGRRPRKLLRTPACKSEKSAPLSTALACRRDSTSPALASFRTSKYWISQSHSACNDCTYLRVAISSFVVAPFCSLCVTRSPSMAALAASLWVSAWESSDRFAAESFIDCS